MAIFRDVSKSTSLLTLGYLIVLIISLLVIGVEVSILLQGNQSLEILQKLDSTASTPA